MFPGKVFPGPSFDSRFGIRTVSVRRRPTEVSTYSVIPSPGGPLTWRLCAKGFESEEFRVPELDTDYKEVRES